MKSFRVTEGENPSYFDTALRSDLEPPDFLCFPCSSAIALIHSKACSTGINLFKDKWSDSIKTEVAGKFDLFIKISTYYLEILTYYLQISTNYRKSFTYFEIRVG